MNRDRTATFLHPARELSAGIGGLLIVAALAGAGFVIATASALEPARTVVQLAFALAVAAIGWGLTNAWRTPLLVVEPGRILVPTFFAQREISVRPGHRAGELLASSPSSSHRAGPIEANKFVYFFALAPDGTVEQIVALHRAAPMIQNIRHALHKIAGLPIDHITRDPGARRPWPDAAAWRDRLDG